MPTDWTDKVRNAITNLEDKTDRVLEPNQALAIIDDVVEGKLAAYELAIIHGIPEAWIEVTLGHICTIASPSAIAGEGFSSTRGSFDYRFIQPDLSHQPETPQIVMLSPPVLQSAE